MLPDMAPVGHVAVEDRQKPPHTNWRIAHYNLRLIREALAPKPGFGPR
jgi:hypothetical protein